MSSQENTKAVNPQAEGTPPDAGAPRLTLTQYQQLADALSADLDAFAAKMPTIDMAPETLAALINANKTVPAPAIGNAIAAVSDSPVLQATQQLDVGVAREVMQFIEAFRPIETKLLGLANQLHVAMAAKRASVGDGVRRVRKIVKNVTAGRPGDPLAQHAANMKRDYYKPQAKLQVKKDQKGGTPTTTGTK